MFSILKKLEINGRDLDKTTISCRIICLMSHFFLIIIDTIGSRFVTQAQYSWDMSSMSLIQ